jgi:hypothetical protein
MVLFLLLDVSVILLLFAFIFRYLPDAKIDWRDVWIGSSLTAVLFVLGKFILAFYLGSGAARHRVPDRSLLARCVADCVSRQTHTTDYLKIPPTTH